MIALFNSENVFYVNELSICVTICIQSGNSLFYDKLSMMQFMNDNACETTSYSCETCHCSSFGYICNKVSFCET